MQNTTCRCHRQREQNSTEILFNLSLIILLSDSSFGSGICDHVLLVLRSSAKGEYRPDPLSEVHLHFGGRFCRLRSEVEMLIQMALPGRWVGLKDDFANYRLNSSPVVSEPARFGGSQPSTWRGSEGVRPRIASCNILFF